MLSSYTVSLNSSFEGHVSRFVVRFALIVVCCTPLLSVSAGITRTWTGAVSTAFSQPNNWSPAGIPASDDSLVFPAATLDNDLPAGTAFGPMHFNGIATLSGNPLTLTGDVTIAANASLTSTAAVKIGAALTLGDGNGGCHCGAVDVNGQTLTFSSPWHVTSLTGSGTVIVSPTLTLIHVDQDGTFDGTFMGGIQIAGSLPNANVVHVGAAWPYVAGKGTLGTVEAQIVRPGDPALVGTLTTKSIDIRNTGVGVNGVFYDLNAAGASDLVQVSGTVRLEDPPLVVTLSGTPVFGQQFRLIDNDGSDPVSGTFSGLPEGTAVDVNGYAFRITYAGGDGNDVELVMAATPSAALSQGADTSVTGEPVALQAVLSSQFGTPSGTVTFLDNGIAIGTTPLVNGTATFNASIASVGSHTITATYSGGGAFFGAVSGPVTHTVSKGDTTTSIQTVHTPVLFGAAEFRVFSTPKAPAAGTVTGTFTLREGKTVLGSGAIDADGHLFLSTLPVGTHTLVASYGGSDAFLGSDSAPFTVEVIKAPTEIQVTREGDTPSKESAVILHIIVASLTSTSVLPTGTVMISDNSSVSSVQPLVGTLTVTLTLAGGPHVISLNYSGDANFFPTATQILMEVDVPPASRRRAVRH
jgi:hypothetical protein